MPSGVFRVSSHCAAPEMVSFASVPATMSDPTVYVPSLVMVVAGAPPHADSVRAAPPTTAAMTVLRSTFLNIGSSSWDPVTSPAVDGGAGTLTNETRPHRVRLRRTGCAPRHAPQVLERLGH